MDWEKITNFFNGVIEEANVEVDSRDVQLEVDVYSPVWGETLSVVIPARLVEDFMKHLPLFEAEVSSGSRSNPAEVTYL